MPDNIRFVRCSFQAVDGMVTALDFQNARNCVADFCRFETVSQAPLAVKWGAGAAYCSLVEPYPPQFAVTSAGTGNFSWVRGKLT